MNISADSKRNIQELFDKYPYRKQEILTGMRERGIPTDWIGEDPSLDLSEEMREVKRGIMEGITFGLADSGESNPFVQTIDLPIFGKTSPSRFAGNVAGSIPAALTAYGLAGKAAQAAGMTGRAAKVAQIVGGEAVPGAAVGAVKSDGDLTEALKYASVWTGLGLLSEGALVGFGRAVNKLKKGDRLNSADKEAVSAFQKAKDIQNSEGMSDAVKMEVDAYEGIQYSGKPDEAAILKAPPTVIQNVEKKFFELLRGLETNKVKVNDVKEQFKSFVDNTIDNSETLSYLASYGYSTAMKIKSLYADIIEEYATKVDEGSLASDDALRELKERLMYYKSELREREAQQAAEGKVGIGTEATEGNVGIGTESAGDIPTSPKGPQPEEKLIGNPELDLQRLRRYGSIEFDDTGSVFLPEVEDLSPEGASITERQADMIFNLERLLRAEGDFASSSQAEVAKLSMRQARKRAQQLKQQLAAKRNASDNAAFTSFLQKEVDESMLIDPEDMTSGVDVGKLSAIEKLHYERTQDALKSGKVTGYNEFVNPKVSEDLIYKEPGMLWFWKIMPPSARRGLSKNPLAKARVIDTLNTLELIGRDSKQYLDRLKGVSSLLSGETATKDNLTRFFSKSAQQRIDDTYNLKVMLVRALDSTPQEANKILSQDSTGKLVEAYSQSRQILDELADMLGLETNERISNYFPHLFDGRVGSFRANRIINELGPESTSIPGLMPVEVGAGLPKGKAFFASKERIANDPDFIKDFDSVMYTYIRGAVDKVYMDPLMRRVSNTVNALPKRTKSGKMAWASSELQSWFSYVIGAPTKWKHAQANWWRDNETFNRWVDNAVSYLGNAQDKELLTKARLSAVQDLSASEQQQLTGFFDKLVKDADKYERIDGPNGAYYQTKRPELKKYRAQLALMVDDLRSALSDPARKPIVLEKLYTLMVINKLGFSISHGLINTTQYLTNTVPLLGGKYSARGVKHYAAQRDPSAKINGRRVSDIIEESGVQASFYEATEFKGQGRGIFKVFDDLALTPATVSEDFLRTSTMLGSYEKGVIEEGLTHAEALAKAKALVRRTQFVYNRAGAPTLFHGPLVRFLLMFKTYPIHQMNFSAELLEDAMKGNPAPFFKHMLAYIGMAGVGATILGKDGLDTRIGDLTQHPVITIPEDIDRRGVMDTIGGPPASALLEVLHGQYLDALEDATTPVILKRIDRSIEQGDPLIATGIR